MPDSTQETWNRLQNQSRAIAPGAADGPPFESTHAGRLHRLAKEGVAASLAGGIIAAGGKPHTVDEAVKVLHEVLAAMKIA